MEVVVAVVDLCGRFAVFAATVNAVFLLTGGCRGLRDTAKEEREKQSETVEGVIASSAAVHEDVVVVVDACAGRGGRGGGQHAVRVAAQHAVRSRGATATATATATALAMAVRRMATRGRDLAFVGHEEGEDL